MGPVREIPCPWQGANPPVATSPQVPHPRRGGNLAPGVLEAVTKGGTPRASPCHTSGACATSGSAELRVSKEEESAVVVCTLTRVVTWSRYGSLRSADYRRLAIGVQCTGNSSVIVVTAHNAVDAYTSVRVPRVVPV